jgi:hypothetical protein
MIGEVIIEGIFNVLYNKSKELILTKLINKPNEEIKTKIVLDSIILFNDLLYGYEEFYKYCRAITNYGKILMQKEEIRNEILKIHSDFKRSKFGLPINKLIKKYFYEIPDDQMWHIMININNIDYLFNDYFFKQIPDIIDNHIHHAKNLLEIIINRISVIKIHFPFAFIIFYDCLPSIEEINKIIGLSKDDFIKELKRIEINEQNISPYFSDQLILSLRYEFVSFANAFINKKYPQGRYSIYENNIDNNSFNIERTIFLTIVMIRAIQNTLIDLKKICNIDKYVHQLENADKVVKISEQYKQLSHTYLNYIIDLEFRNKVIDWMSIVMKSFETIESIMNDIKEITYENIVSFDSDQYITFKKNLSVKKAYIKKMQFAINELYNYCQDKNLKLITNRVKFSNLKKLLGEKLKNELHQYYCSDQSINNQKHIKYSKEIISKINKLDIDENLSTSSVIGIYLRLNRLSIIHNL